MKDVSNLRCLEIDSNGDIHGLPDYTRYNNLNWFKKSLCMLSYRYKRKFIDIKGYKIKSFKGLNKNDFITENCEIGDEIEPGVFGLIINK